MTDINIVIAGSAGEGIQTIGEILSEAVLAQGHSVFSWQEYESRIRGGQNSYTIRIGDKTANAPEMRCDVLLALNGDAARKYLFRLKPDGILISPAKIPNGPESAIEIDFTKTAAGEIGKKIYANTIAVGVLAGAIGVGKEALNTILGSRFEKKGREIVDANRLAAEKGFQLAEKECQDICPWTLDPKDRKWMLVNGNVAICLGAAYAGCKMVAGYPMTPSTEIMTWLAKHEDTLGILVEQAEDEISAVNMVIGANFAGTRAMTATSGGGFSLMAEGVSLSGMTETPLVAVLGQRPGPATGLPTRTAQQDLLFAIHAGHGEFPRLVMAPADPKDAFHKTVAAFNLADKYQIPAIILTDQLLAESAYALEDLDIEKSTPVFHMADPNTIETYKRYQFVSENPSGGASPRLYPGQSRHLVGAVSDEHDEYGHLTEDLENTALPMIRKRLSKMAALQREIPPPETFGAANADILFIGWGSSRGALLEAIDMLREKDGIEAGAIHFTVVWPLPETPLDAGKNYWVVESNATGQLGKLLKSAFDLNITGNINRFDGLPLTAEFIRSRFHEQRGSVS